MKRTNTVFLILLTGAVFLLTAAGARAQNAAPKFDKRPSVVLDLWENGGMGKYKDYVKFTSAILNQNISFTVYGYEQKSGNWTQIGAAQLKSYCDIDTVDSPYRGGMNEFRWLAVHSTNNTAFAAQALPYRNDILITVYRSITAGTGKPASNDTAPVFSARSSVVLDLWANGNKGKYKDYVKLTNGSKTPEMSLNVYGYDQKNNQWMIIGPAQFKKISDTDTVSTPWRGRMNEFRWLAVHSLNDISLNAKAAAGRNDITIMIVDK
ncbi:MAG: hypothetical protein LBB81_09695 [Treponema sp.]|jgi:hypothetical protein|nr:hypothetical protein [Treponema sp.]